MAVITKRKIDNGERWQAKIRRKGWPPASKTFDRKADAEAWARAVEREMDVGSFVQRDDAERTTFREAAERYKREVLPTKRAQLQPRYMLGRLCERFGRYSLASISPAMLAEYSGTLRTALSRARSASELIIHSDQGWHYKMQPYRAMLASCILHLASCILHLASCSAQQP